MNPTEKHDGVQHVLYDADQLSGIEPMMFDPLALQRAGLVQGSAEGRGTTHFIELNGKSCVLRHYRRGGLARLLGDCYLRCNLPQTRAWREWHLLASLAAQGLPVPQPVAAQVITHGLFYRADLIMQRLNGTRSLSQALKNDAALSEKQWEAIGQCIRRFHDAGVYHADLNAHNILLGAEERVWLIDFDRGEIRSPADNWQQANLARLRRSLDKLSTLQRNLHGVFHFTDADWQKLMLGWGSAP